MKVLVTGATGSVGGHVVNQLASQGIEVKALSRHANSVNYPENVHAIIGDLNHPESLKEHLEDTDSLFLLTQSEQTEERLAANQRIIQLAKEAGVKRIVAIMDYEGNPIERVIQESEMEWTILRPVEFMKNALYFWAESIQKHGCVEVGFPETLSARIHEADIASVAVKALTENGHHREIYQLTGPQKLSIREMISQIAEVIGKPVKLLELTEEQVRQNAKDQGFDDEFIDYFIIGMAKNPPESVYTVLPTVEQVTGRPARSFAQWVHENKHYFT